MIMALQSLLLNTRPEEETEQEENANNKEFATTESTFKATPTGAWTPKPEAIVAVFIPSTKMQAESKTIAMEKITWTVTGCTLAGHTHSGGANTEPMVATSEKCEIETKGIMRKGDKQNCQGTFIPIGGPPNVTCSCEIEIDVTGQTKLLGS